MRNVPLLTIVSALSFGGCSSESASTPNDASAGGAGGTSGTSAGSAGSHAGAAGFSGTAGTGPAGTAGMETGGASAGTTSTGGAAGSAPIRTATTRSLLATSTRSVLLDPFFTSDDSLGHFVGLLLPPPPNQFVEVPPARAFVSLSPGGVAAPVASFPPPSSVHTWGKGVQIIAPFPGGSDGFDARIWVSVGDMSGHPVPFDATAASIVTVSLLPNDLPSLTYPLSKVSAPVSYAGREWVALSLPTPVSMPKGGWFSVILDDPNATLQLQAPEVVPAGMANPPPAANPGTRTARDRTTLKGYVDITRRAPRLSSKID